MSYEFIKLSEVEKVDTSYNANLLIEENGEIKRLSTENINFGGSGNQVQADWNETDDTSPAYIANKPSMNQEIITYSTTTGSLYRDGEIQTIQQIKDAWDSGASLRIGGWLGGNETGKSGLVLAASFGESSGSYWGVVRYIDADDGSLKSHNLN